MTASEPAVIVPLRSNRDFRRLWVGHALSDVGSRAADLAMPLLVLALTGSPVQAGAVGSIRLAAFVLFALPGGALADRWDRRRAMLGAETVRAAAVGLVAGAIWAGCLSISWLIVFAVVDAAGMALIGPAHTATLRHIVPRSQLGIASAREEARSYAAELAGPPLGGALFGIASWAPFLADALSYLASILAIARIQTPLRDRPDRAPSCEASIGTALKFIWHQPVLRIALALAPITNMAFTGVLFALIVVLRERGLAPAGIGAVQTTVMAGGLLGAVGTPWLLARLRPASVIIRSSWSAAVLTMTLALLPGTYTLAGPLLLLMLFGPAENAIFFSYQVSLTPDHLQGRVQGITGMLSQVASPLGLLLGGVLIEHEGSHRTFLTLGALLAVAAVLATTSRSIRNIQFETAITTGD